MKLLIEAHYLPCTSYFSKILSYDEVIIESRESFSKQTFRNRCRILGSNKVMNLVIPIKHTGSEIRQAEIDYSQTWLKDHWRGITSSYGKTPYFEYYAEYFKEILLKKHQYLFDLNIDLMTLCLRLLKVNKALTYTDVYETTVNDNIIDYRDIISPKNKSYNTDIVTSVRYSQAFGKDFVPGLSIIDLLFNHGINSVDLLKKQEEKNKETNN